MSDQCNVTPQKKVMFTFHAMVVVFFLVGPIWTFPRLILSKSIQGTWTLHCHWIYQHRITSGFRSHLTQLSLSLRLRLSSISQSSDAWLAAKLNFWRLLLILLTQSQTQWQCDCLHDDHRDIVPTPSVQPHSSHKYQSSSSSIQHAGIIIRLHDNWSQRQSINIRLRHTHYQCTAIVKWRRSLHIICGFSIYRDTSRVKEETSYQNSARAEKLFSD